MFVTLSGSRDIRVVTHLPNRRIQNANKAETECWHSSISVFRQPNQRQSSSPTVIIILSQFIRRQRVDYVGIETIFSEWLCAISFIQFAMEEPSQAIDGLPWTRWTPNGTGLLFRWLRWCDAAAAEVFYFVRSTRPELSEPKCEHTLNRKFRSKRCWKINCVRDNFKLLLGIGRVVEWQWHVLGTVYVFGCQRSISCLPLCPLWWRCWLENCISPRRFRLRPAFTTNPKWHHNDVRKMGNISREFLPFVVSELKRDKQLRRVWSGRAQGMNDCHCDEMIENYKLRRNVVFPTKCQ